MSTSVSVTPGSAIARAAIARLASSIAIVTTVLAFMGSLRSLSTAPWPDAVEQDCGFARPQPDTLDDRQQRDDVDAATDPQALGFQDHEGQGQREVKRRPAPALGPDTDRAAERLDVAGHDIHSDPTAGN